ncbi:MAG: T9SS type A sorting domain-containing protein [Chitinophagaceae bacterium]
MAAAPAYTYDAADPGTYLVKIKTTNGCEYLSNSVTVLHYPAIAKPFITQKTPDLLSVPGTYTTYQWYRNNKLIPGATASAYTYSFDGAYFVQVWDANTCYTFSDTIVLNNLSVNEATSDARIRVYPNPVTDEIHISNSLYAGFDIVLSDLSGRILLQAAATNVINVRSLAAGMYFLRLSESGTGNYIETIKVERAAQ